MDDPLADRIAALLTGQDDAAGRVRAILTLDTVMPPALRQDAVFADLLTAHLSSLEDKGAMATLIAMTPLLA